MEPKWLKEGYYVRLSNDDKDRVLKVIAVEPFEYETGEEVDTIFTTVASGAQSDFKPIKPLEPDDNPPHLFQVLWGVKSGGRYYIKIPTGTNRFGIDEDYDIGYVDNEKSPYHNPNPRFQFYTVADWYPAINFVNNTGGTITPKIWFKGLKYDVKEVIGTELTLNREKATLLTMGGVKS